jgi:hypothetical protein
LPSWQELPADGSAAVGGAPTTAAAPAATVTATAATAALLRTRILDPQAVGTRTRKTLDPLRGFP